MSQERVRILCEVYRAFNEGHLLRPEYVASDVEFVQPDGLAGGEGTYTVTPAFALASREWRKPSPTSNS